MFSRIQLVCVMLAAGAASMAMTGCAAEADAPSAATSTQRLTSTYGDVTVVGERALDGTVTIEARSASGEALLVLVIRGSDLDVVPRADRSVAPWSGPIPAEATANELEDWNYVAYAYSQHLTPPQVALDAQGGLKPRMMSAGTDGQMCIAAGGTAMQCTAWLYCRNHWCPFW